MYNSAKKKCRYMCYLSGGGGPISKDYILYDFIYITFLNDKIIELKTKLVVSSVVNSTIKGSTREFLGVMKQFCILLVITEICT